MDFFTSQDVARKKTGRLVILFAIAVFCIIALVYAAVAVFVQVGHEKSSSQSPPPAFFNPQLMLGVGLGVGLLVLLSSSFKISQLRAGGHVVAEMLGGTRIDPNHASGQERMVLNVVEEMAIASGTPVPPVYLLDEGGINAFAAGYSANDAVIGITRGAVQTLSRDELQGVIAHEFSHILNGDMRLNIRLMGMIFGIIVLSVIGYHMMRVGFYGGGRKDKNGLAAIGILGLAIMIIGYVGTFFANLIKAAVSRQREYLADASAVQFTRNPTGIAGALKKIGGWPSHSRLEHPESAEVSHLLFGSGVERGFASLFATHPPLDDRIRRIDPSFNGKFPQTQPLGAGSEGAMGFTGGRVPPSLPPHAPIELEPATEAGSGRTISRTPPPLGRQSLGLGPVQASAVDQIGRPSQKHLDYASTLIGALPARVTAVVHEAYGARAVIYALLINDDAEPRLKQLASLRQSANRAVYDETVALLPVMSEVDRAARLPLIDMATPALKTLSPGQYREFMTNIEALVRADDKLDLFEWALQRILRHHLEPTFSGAKPAKVRHASLNGVADPCSVLLSTLCYLGQGDLAAAGRAFEAAKSRLAGVAVKLVEPAACGIRSVSAALDELAAVATKEKRRLLEACAACISADNQVTIREAELFRAVCDSLGCPMPPILPGQPLAA